MELVESSAVAIVGGGVTGLAAGMASGGTVFEAAPEPGGICCSYYVRPGSAERLARRPDDGDAYRFEVGGGHWIFGGDPEVLAVLDGLAPMREHVRRASVHFARSGQTVPYPFQDHVAALDPALAERAGADPRPPLPDARPATMAEWMAHRFGRTLCKRFFDPFHERYTAGLYRSLAPQDAYKSPQGQGGYNVTFRYPPAGLDVLARAMAARADVRYGHRVVRIDPEAKQLVLADGRVAGYERLICTLPLDTALELCGIGPEVLGPPDPCTSVLVVNIGAGHGPRCPESHWVYEPEAAAGFHRYGVYSNVDPSFLPDGRPDRVALYVEHAVRRGDRLGPEAEAEIVAATVAELAGRGVIGEVEVVDVSWVPSAYTWAVPGSTWARDAVALLADRGVEQVGRYARWHFQGIAESVGEGFAAGEGAVSGAPPPVAPVPPGTARPQWSVMIPTCNDAELLPRALTSVLEQAPGPEVMQIEVVDDASTDVDVASLVRRIAGDRVEVHQHPARVGAPRNFTACAARSTGRWVHILHADDFVLPGFYDAYGAHLEAHPAAMAVARSWFVDGEEQRHGLSGPLVGSDGYLVDAERVLALDNPVNFVAVVVDRRTFEQVGGFRPDLVHANDWELWTRIAHHGPVALVEGEHACYRVHGGSDTTRLQGSMVYLTDPVAAARTITGRIDDPAVRREVRRHIHRRLAEHALRVGAQQAEAHEHRLAATSALWAARLSPDPSTLRSAARLAASAVRNRTR